MQRNDTASTVDVSVNLAAQLAGVPEALDTVRKEMQDGMEEVRK